MTTFFLPPAPGGLSYARRSSIRYASAPKKTQSYCYPVGLDDAQEDLDVALQAGELNAQALAGFLGAVVLGQPAELLVHEYYLRASCDCCEDRYQDFLVLS